MSTRSCLHSEFFIKLRFFCTGEVSAIDIPKRVPEMKKGLRLGGVF